MRQGTLGLHPDPHPILSLSVSSSNPHSLFKQLSAPLCLCEDCAHRGLVTCPRSVWELVGNLR